jgi:RES domain-containing protein
MSPNIWTQCAARCSRIAGSFRRVVESQFVNSTRKLVDSDAEQAVLEELLDARAKLPVPLGFEKLHYLLYTPFRHPPLRNGSRFGTRQERGILYGSRELPTAFAEVAYYRLLFLEGTAADLGTVQVELTAFRFGIAAPRGVDLTRPPFTRFQEEISSKVRYDASQQLGREMRQAGAQCCLYVSARAATPGVNVAVFENVFAPPRPSGEERWSCAASRSRVELKASTLLGRATVLSFERTQFEVDGALPAPAF